MHVRSSFLVFLAAAAGVLSAGCKVGPDYCQPTVQHSCAWIDAHNPRLQGQIDDPAKWWSVFQDECLDTLIDEALDENLTLKQAGMRVVEARYLRGVAVGGLFPQSQTAGGEFTHRQRSLNTAQAFPPLTNRSFDLAVLELGAVWEVDFWGRFRRSIEAADAELEASCFAHHDAVVILLGDVTQTYIEIRALQQRLMLVRRNVELQQRTLNLVQKKFDAGLVAKLDLAQAEASLYQTESLIPDLEVRHRQASNRLCVLLGMPPTDIGPCLGGVGEIPSPPGEVAVGIPADLVRQRPDVRRAERQLAAQCARIGVAESDFYPRVSVSGELGVASQNVGNLFQSTSLAAAVGPSVRWNILNFGRIKNNARMQEAAFERLEYAYRQSVLDATRQVEDALVTFLKSHDRIAALERAVDASNRFGELSLLQYDAGTTDFTRVFQAQAELIKQQDRLALAKSESSQSLVAVYRALGGGW